jgi:N-acetylmuramoyl-L-alanine amidase
MSLAERFRRGFGKIVIDPGHGGKDPGAIGRSGIYEKDIVLDISKRLANSLRRGLRAKVLLTRTNDRFLSLDARSAFANRNGADLFISVHANSSSTRGLSGIETYLLSEASDERALKVAARENGVPVQELSDLQIILADLRVRGQINRSAPLAEFVHEQMISNLSRRYSRVRDLGVKQAPFYVLLGAKMPSILVEVGFLSHRRGEDRLRSPKYRQSLASSMSDGIRKFIKQTQLARQVD